MPLLFLHGFNFFRFENENFTDRLEKVREKRNLRVGKKRRSAVQLNCGDGICAIRHINLFRQYLKVVFQW